MPFHESRVDEGGKIEVSRPKVDRGANQKSDVHFLNFCAYGRLRASKTLGQGCAAKFPPPSFEFRLAPTLVPSDIVSFPAFWVGRRNGKGDP